MTGLDDRRARMLLGRWSEPGDAALVGRVREQGAVAVVQELIAGASPLAHATSLSVRMPAGSIAAAADRERCAGEAAGARYVVPGDREWPTQLEDLGDAAPLGLWVAGAGDLRLLALRSVAVVGARAATGYGEGIARVLAADLADAGWATVSGGAYGIDAAAHRGALVAEGATVCILAGGVDVPYPRAHDELLARIRAHGALVSEAPLGGAAMRQRFLTRNRLIAALTRGTVVVEAALRSGSRTTAAAALRLSRIVMAFPGPVTSPQSQGCHALLRAPGVELVTSSAEVLAHLGHGTVTGLRAEGLEPREARVLDAVPVRRPAPVSSIARTAGLVIDEVQAALGILEAEGLVSRGEGGWARARGR
ncbi:MAG: DNA-processing protein DprA [Candidatus Nanopelagicales bacterium]